MNKKASIALGIIVILQLTRKFFDSTATNIAYLILILPLGAFFIANILKQLKDKGEIHAVKAIKILVSAGILVFIILSSLAIFTIFQNK